METAGGCGEIRRIGTPGGTRTPNLRFWRPLLCQLSYWRVSGTSGLKSVFPQDGEGGPPGGPPFALDAAAFPPPQAYFRILATTPAPTVRPPSRIAKRRPSSIATGLISDTFIFTLSPGITISVPSGSSTAPVMSVVRK